MYYIQKILDYRLTIRRMRKKQNLNGQTFYRKNDFFSIFFYSIKTSKFLRKATILQQKRLNNPKEILNYQPKNELWLFSTNIRAINFNIYFSALYILICFNFFYLLVNLGDGINFNKNVFVIWRTRARI